MTASSSYDDAEFPYYVKDPMTQPHFLAVLRGVHQRDFEREGIPMVLALVSTVAPVPDATQPQVRADGAAFATTVAAARAELFPTRRDEDMGCLASTVQAASTIAFTGGGAR